MEIFSTPLRLQLLHHINIYLYFGENLLIFRLLKIVQRTNALYTPLPPNLLVILLLIILTTQG